MKSRTLAAAAAALASLTFSQSQAATATTIVYTGPTILQAGVLTAFKAYVDTPDGRVAGPFSLTFKLGALAPKSGNALENQSVASTNIKPTVVGDDQPLVISYGGNATLDLEADTLTTSVDVYESVLLDSTGVGMVMLNPSRNELRVISGDYDSGLLTNVQMTAAGPALLLDVNATDADGGNLTLKGMAIPSNGHFAVVGQGSEPILLAA